MARALMYMGMDDTEERKVLYRKHPRRTRLVQLHWRALLRAVPGLSLERAWAGTQAEGPSRQPPRLSQSLPHQPLLGPTRSSTSSQEQVLKLCGHRLAGVLLTLRLPLVLLLLAVAAQGDEVRLPALLRAWPLLLLLQQPRPQRVQQALHVPCLLRLLPLPPLPRHRRAQQRAATALALRAAMWCQAAVMGRHRDTGISQIPLVQGFQIQQILLHCQHAVVGLDGERLQLCALQEGGATAEGVGWFQWGAWCAGVFGWVRPQRVGGRRLGERGE